eukprot:NODE_1103_length_1702_cov_361.280702_g977_i0.p1 GENE.NODE_1103_length_1702_cov_361.280702_g977_i0~~NODE_1103_length_1702_cov_361.280702_g977_i0.p1  ORF type:complete len:532 (+),score=73.86 NODE_1103_length_1702_cov_361.280702_g977_i0:67-1662(+)
MEPSMEFGGYVDPPTHLKQTSKKNAPQARPAELRTIPDYDYSLFRYSKIALPFLALILLSAAILMGLTFWQGPFGYNRGVNGIQDGVPRDFHLENENQFWNTDREGGLRKNLRSMRCANFCLGALPLLICIFAIRKQPSPGLLKGLLLLCAFFFFALACLSFVTAAFGIYEVQELEDCPDLTFSTEVGSAQGVHFSPVDFDLRSASSVCWRREQLTSAAIAADFAQALTALILTVLLVYTTRKSSWAWGAGKIPVEKNVNQPRIQFPPPSPFTHIAETRRTYVWMTIFALMAFVIIAFILTIVMHELRIKPRWVDSRNQVLERSGWPQRNNRLRVSLTGFVIAVAGFSLLDLAGWKKRLVSFLLGIVFFWLAAGMFIVFALDVHDVSKAQDLTCPTPLSTTPGGQALGRPGLLVEITCYYWAYYGTIFLDFWLGFVILVYIIYEYLYRSTTWDSYYFYSDSEWLRNHSLFVDETDREAFDWKKFVMDSGREYYYSPSLGISTRSRPRNFVDPADPSPFMQGFPGAGVPPYM